MLTRINKHRDEAGFTLIELLVVVIIIGILAAIAIPVFLNQRNSARDASVQSDLRTIATEAETYYTENLSYPGTGTGASNAVPVSDNNAYQYTAVSNGTFEIAGCNIDSKSVFYYDSDGGGITTDAPTTAYTCPNASTGDTFTMGTAAPATP